MKVIISKISILSLYFVGVAVLSGIISDMVTTILQKLYALKPHIQKVYNNDFDFIYCYIALILITVILCGFFIYFAASGDKRMHQERHINTLKCKNGEMDETEGISPIIS